MRLNKTTKGEASKSRGATQPPTGLRLLEAHVTAKKD